MCSSVYSSWGETLHLGFSVVSALEKTLSVGFVGLSVKGETLSLGFSCVCRVVKTFNKGGGECSVCQTRNISLWDLC